MKASFSMGVHFAVDIWEGMASEFEETGQTVDIGGTGYNKVAKSHGLTVRLTDIHLFPQPTTGVTFLTDFFPGLILLSIQIKRLSGC